MVLCVAIIGAGLAIVQRLASSNHSSWLKGVKAWRGIGRCNAHPFGLPTCSAIPLFRAPSRVESFNRPLVEKINDVSSPRYRAVLATMVATRRATHLPVGFCRHRPYRTGGQGEFSVVCRYGIPLQRSTILFPRNDCCQSTHRSDRANTSRSVSRYYPSPFAGLDIALWSGACRRGLFSARSFDRLDLCSDPSRLGMHFDAPWNSTPRHISFTLSSEIST